MENPAIPSAAKSAWDRPQGICDLESLSRLSQGDTLQVAHFPASRGSRPAQGRCDRAQYFKSREPRARYRLPDKGVAMNHQDSAEECESAWFGGISRSWQFGWRRAAAEWTRKSRLERFSSSRGSADRSFRERVSNLVSGTTGLASVRRGRAGSMSCKRLRCPVRNDRPVRASSTRSLERPCAVRTTVARFIILTRTCQLESRRKQPELRPRARRFEILAGKHVRPEGRVSSRSTTWF